MTQLQAAGAREPALAPEPVDDARTAGRWAFSRGQLFMLLAIALPAVTSLIAPMATQDIAYQVRFGQLLLEQGSIPGLDPFTFTMAGEPWLNQQWAAGLVFGAGYGIAGWAGLFLLRAVLIGAIYGLVFAAARGVGANSLVASVVTLASFLVAMSNLALRAQTLGVLCFATVVAILVFRRRHPWLLVLLPLVFVGWANAHGSFFVGWAAIAVAALEDLWARSRLAAATVGALAVSVPASLVNPWGMDMWAYVVELSSDPLVSRLVSEWQPSTLRTPTGIFFFASLAAVSLLLLLRGRVLSWLQLAWLAGLAALALMAARGVAWWAIGAAPAAAVLLAGLVLRGRRLGDPELDEPRGVGYTAVAALLLVLLVIALPVWRPSDPLYGPEGMLRGAPRAVSEAIRSDAGPDDRLLAEQTWGSWLELAAPGVPLMVDSRIELYDEAVWSDYLAAVNARADWPAILAERGITMVALMPGTALNAFIAEDPGWTRIGGDGEGIVYRRATP